jgi:hypothetical protein
VSSRHEGQKAIRVAALLAIGSFVWNGVNRNISHQNLLAEEVAVLFH